MPTQLWLTWTEWRTAWDTEHMVKSVDLRERGIDESQSADLRRRLAPFAEDWDRPEMASVYNGTKPSWFRHFCIRSSPNDQQVLDRGAHVQPLRNNNDAGDRIAFKESCQMSGHRLSIVRDQNSPGLSGEPQHSGV